VHGAEAAKDSAGLRYDPDILDLADVGVRTAQLCYRTFSRASSSLPSRRAAPRRRAPFLRPWRKGGAGRGLFFNDTAAATPRKVNRAK